MNKLTSLKCAAVLLPALAVGIPMANASDEKRDDPQESAKTASTYGADRQDQRKATTNKEFFETNPARAYLSDSLVGHEVMSRSSDKSVGEISNLLLDENGQVVAAIISVGGTLGIGEHDVAIAWDQIERRADGDETTLWVNQTEQSLKDAPKFSGSMKNAQETSYSRQEDQSAGKRQDTNRPEKPAVAASNSSASMSDKTKSDAKMTTHSQFLTTIPTRGYHSDSLIGHEVTNRRSNESIGKISDLVLDQDGQLVAVILRVGGVMGLGEREVAISWDQIERKVNGDEITLFADLTEESLKDAPDYLSANKQSRK
jgi:sporulation protein YlmC with PRC-barrel domain